LWHGTNGPEADVAIGLSFMKARYMKVRQIETPEAHLRNGLRECTWSKPSHRSYVQLQHRYDPSGRR